MGLGRGRVCAPALIAWAGLTALAAFAAMAALAPVALADTMSLALSREALQGQTTQVLYSASSQTEGFVTMAVNPGDVPCGSVPEEDAGVALIQPELLTAAQTGAFSGSVNYTPSEAGAFIVCGWVSGYGEYENKTGGPVIASASLPIEVHPVPVASASPPGASAAPHTDTSPHAGSHASRGVHGHARARKHAHHLAGSRARVRACRAESLGRYIVTIHARGISCVSARSVVGAAEHTPLPADVVRTPYFKYSPPYTVSTPAGRFVCRFEPFGLAGTEHNIRCTRARVLVRWSTVQE